MKIECIKEQLEEALNKASRVAKRNITLPVLEGFYLDATKKNLSIKATNLDLGISIALPARIIEPGAVVVPANTLRALVTSLPREKNITMRVNKQVLELKTLRVSASIKTLPPEDFPIIPEIGGGEDFSMPIKDFVLGVRSVVYASALGSIKPEISSVSIANERGFLVFAATDSFRLAEKRVKTKNSPPFKQILIPQKNAQEIIKIFDNGEEDITVSIEEHQIALRSQNIYLTSRVVEGTFPDYKQIIPKETTTKATLLKQDLINSLKTSLIFSNAFGQLTLRLSLKEKSFEIDSTNTEVGESLARVDAVLEGEDISININHRYFTEGFQAISVDSVSLSFSGQASPIIIQGVGDPNFLYLMMPMNQS